MTSERQKAANRANARHATGPKTPEGKAAIRLNARSHGLFVRDVVLPEEDADAFEDLFTLAGGADREISGGSCGQRYMAPPALGTSGNSAALFRMHGLKADRLAGQVASYEVTFPGLVLPPDITDQAAHAEASEALRRARYEQKRDEVLLGRAIDADAKEGDALAKLSRYERSLERSLFRAHDELCHIQDKRQNRHSPPILDAATLNTEDIE
jgi:hypothetical protein